jgi:hypothetical protein
MKKVIFTCALFLSIFAKVNAQIDTSTLIDNASAMVSKGDNADIGRALDLVSMSLKGDQGGGIFKDKLIGQVANLGSVSSALKNGVVDKGAMTKSLGLLKTMLAGQALSNMVSSNTLAGNASKVLSNINTVKSGLSLLGDAGQAASIGKVLSKVGDKSAKLDKTGFFSGFAKRAARKKLGSALGSLSGLL